MLSEMPRAIIRFSLNRDNGSITTQVKNLLDRSGFTWGGTASYEATAISEARLSSVIDQIVNLMPNDRSVEIDHLWVFMDRADSASAGSGST
jgi:hypothetical protein